MLLTTDSLYEQYKANEDSIIFNDSIFFNKYYRETGNVKKHQVPYQNI